MTDGAGGRSRRPSPVAPDGPARSAAQRRRHQGDTPYPTAGQLLEAIEALLQWRLLAINENQGGVWFYDPEGMGTRPLDPTEIRSLYEKEAERRGYGR